MALRGFMRRIPTYKIIGEEDIIKIHQSTLDVLWESGAKIYHEKALKVLEKAGCIVDYDESLVKFPPALVEESLRKCPSAFRVKSRNPEHDLIISQDHVVFFNFPGRDIVDLNTWKSRTPTRHEHIDLVRVLDALPTVHFFNNYPYFGYEGIPEVMKEFEGAVIRLTYATKVTMEIANNDLDRFTFQIAQAIGSEIFANPNTSSPLVCYTDQTEACFLAAEYGYPSVIWDGATMASTAPASVAGAVALANAEIIPYIVLLQVLKPGSRVMVADLVLPQNMRTGSPLFGDVSISLHLAVFNQVWQWYGIPTVASSSGVSNSKRIGFQLAYEKVIPSLISAISGSSAVQLHSSVYGEISAHPVQAVLDDDVAGIIGRFLEGVEISEDSIATDLINEVGPIPGHYLAKEHTRRWWKREQYIRKAADFTTYAEWEASGGKSEIDLAKEKVKEILESHKVNPPLTDSQIEDVEKIVMEARRYYRDKGMITDSEWDKYKETIKKEGRPFV